jgi:SpoVK/Ycf46/Vps4 family AAA+-type ATPase
MSKAENSNFKKYKFKEIKVYSSDEWLANSTKKYRRVFDRQETAYIRSEFQFYNKLFDEEAWDAKINLKAISLDGKNQKELCNLETKRSIGVDENVVIAREGWGNEKPGSFWANGDYLWQGFVNDEMLGEMKFHVEDVGLVTPESNPYFTIESLKLFKGSFEVPAKEDRKYFLKFDSNTTQYIWVELKVKIATKKDFFYELFYNFYNDNGLLKGSTDNYAYLEANNENEIYTFTAGWGSNTAGSWKPDNYRLDIIFMDTLIGSLTFEVGEGELEGTTVYNTTINTEKPQSVTTTTAPTESIEDVIKQLDELIGLTDIKSKIKEHVKYLEFIKLRKEKGFQDSDKMSLHSVFTGNPGTGKTTVVNLLGKIYQKMGLLTKGHVLEVDRSDLVGEFIGQTAPKVKAKIEEARGGILFIDEAYMLSRSDDDSKDYGKEVIEVLLKEMSDGNGDIAIMVAGYPAEMEHFIDSNPGLRSRFNYYFNFEDYLPEELMQISDMAAKKRSLTLTETSRSLIFEMLTEAYRNRDKTFGNARYAYSIIDEAKINLGLRLMNHPDVNNLTNEMLSAIELEDIQKIFASKQKAKLLLKVNENLLREALQELHDLIGIKNIKEDITELIKLVRYYHEIGKDVLNKFSLHSVFAGNPGTGKTTVARIIGKIYKALGLLERGHVVECGREGLVAGFVGETAIKTKALIDKSKDGVLFIDEAYALSEGGENDFGKEAIEVILKNMEDMRGKFAVIAAGYPDNMNKFLLSNPGLKSRFDRTYTFNDYAPDELYEISKTMLSKEGLTADAEAEKHLREYFSGLYETKDKYFGNARAVRNDMGEAVKNQNLRMASIPSDNRTPEMISTLTIDDVKEFEIKQVQTRTGVGFKLGEN